MEYVKVVKTDLSLREWCQGICTIVLTLVYLTVTPRDRKNFHHATLFANVSVCNSKL